MPVWDLASVDKVLIMELAGAGMLVSSLVSKITAASTMVSAGGAASSTVLAALSSQGINLLSQVSLGSATSALGTLNVGAVLSGCSPAILAACQVGAKTAAVAAGGAAVTAAAPLVLSALGFTSAGIAAGSLAAKMMSTAAIANGGGVAAGGLVATLQSAGAAGLSLSSKVLVGSAGSAVVSLVARGVGL